MGSGPLLTLESVTAHFGGLKALDGVSIEVEPGCITGLVGPNGAGKSTLFNCVSGLVRASEGTIRFADRLLPERGVADRIRLGIARGFQETRVFEGISVLDNVLIGAQELRSESLWWALRRGRGVKQEERAAREKALRLIRWVGLRDKASNRAGDLSYGQQKLLGLCQLLMSEPQLLMLDEPVAGVRKDLVGTIGDRLREIVAQGRTVLLIEHNMPFVWSLCDFIYVLAEGKVIASGPPEVVKSHEDVIRAYLGRPVEASE